MPDATAEHRADITWRVSDDQWDTLVEARATRPPPASKLSGCLMSTVLGITILCAFGASASTHGNFFLNATLAGGALTSGLLFLRGRKPRIWRRRFLAYKAKKSREVAEIAGSPQAPLLRYQKIRYKPEWEWLTFDAGAPMPVQVDAQAPPIGDAAFDRCLGVRGTEIQRALLGPTLRVNAPRWHVDAGFMIANAQAKVKLGVDGYDGRRTLQQICLAFGEYVDRLSEAPAIALGRLARDLAHPFDAARALALLHTDWDGEAQAVRTAIADDPLGPALAHVARTGEGLLDPVLDWPTRSEIGRGIFGVRGTASTTLANWLGGQAPTDGASAMALAELCESAVSLLDRSELAAPASVALSYVIEHGGPQSLAWMQARARHDKASRVGLKAMSARLQDRHAGLLSLDDEAQRGALSETRAGELSIADDAPPA